MCIIIVGLGSDAPTKEVLEDCAISNPDGFGWAIVARHDDGTNRLITGKSMRDDKAIKEYLGAMSIMGERVLYSVFHARIATHGTTNLDNCHPFQVGEDEGTVLFHNGIMHECHYTDDPRSDTRIFAEEWLPELGGHTVLDKPRVRGLVEGFAVGSKLVIASVERDLPLILNEDSGSWVKNIWYSNMSWRYTYPNTIGSVIKVENWADDNWDLDKCDYCESKLDKSGKCDVCMMCQDCGGNLSTVYADGSTANPLYCSDCEWCHDCQKWVVECLCPPVTNYDKFETVDDDSIRLQQTLQKYAELNGVAL